jgi:hypothetical protein
LFEACPFWMGSFIFVRWTVVAPTAEAVPAHQTGKSVLTSPRRAARAAAWAGTSIGVGGDQDDRIVMVCGMVLRIVRMLHHGGLHSMVPQVKDTGHRGSRIARVRVDATRFWGGAAIQKVTPVMLPNLPGTSGMRYLSTTTCDRLASLASHACGVCRWVVCGGAHQVFGQLNPVIEILLLLLRGVLSAAGSRSRHSWSRHPRPPWEPAGCGVGGVVERTVADGASRAV